jgi:hypothetical protein
MARFINLNPEELNRTTKIYIEFDISAIEVTIYLIYTENQQSTKVQFMSVLSYRDNENYFLEAMATRYEFNGKIRTVFIQRFLEANADLKDYQLADVLEKDLATEKEISCSAIILRDSLYKICQRLQNEGCDFNSVIKGKWQIAKKWLREEKYPEWLRETQNIELMSQPTFDQLWQQLLAKATDTDQMGPELLSLSRDMGSGEECLPLGSHIHFNINLDLSGYLLLLEKGTSGKVWCLCPSTFAPEPFLPNGQTTLPQDSSPLRSFKLTGNPGQEQMVAVVTQESPPLKWLIETNSKPPLQLNAACLNELLNYLNSNPGSRVFYMGYTVTS